MTVGFLLYTPVTQEVDGRAYLYKVKKRMEWVLTRHLVILGFLLQKVEERMECVLNRHLMTVGFLLQKVKEHMEWVLNRHLLIVGFLLYPRVTQGVDERTGIQSLDK